MQRLHVDQLSNVFTQQDPGSRSARRTRWRGKGLPARNWDAQDNGAGPPSNPALPGCGLESTKGLNWEGRLREQRIGVGLDESLSGMTWQDLNVGVARRLWRQGSWAEAEDAGSEVGPGCLSMVQSYGQNWHMPRDVGVIASLRCGEVWQKPDMASPQRELPALRRAQEEQFRGQQPLT